MEHKRLIRRRCDCGISFPIYHCIVGVPTGSGRMLPDRYIKHSNQKCVPCLRNALLEIEAVATRRELTDAELEKRGMLMSMLPQGC